MMIDIGQTTMEITGILDTYKEWLLNIITLTGMSFATVFLICFVIYLVINILLSILSSIFPFIRGIIFMLELLLLPGSLLHIVWHSFAAKKLNIPLEVSHNFNLFFTRTAIKINRPFTSLRESILFFYAPFLNLFVLVGWVIPGMFLFQWLDTIANTHVFYWIWLYVFFSLVVFGLPDLADLINPLHVTVVKTPEFYLFIVFYTILAPITLMLWGYGITILFSLIYAIVGFYEVQKIAKKEEKRLGKLFDKTFSRTDIKYVVVPDSDYYE